MRAIKIILGVFILMLATYFLGPQLCLHPVLNARIACCNAEIRGRICGTS